MPTWSGILNEIQAEVAKGNPSAFDVVRRKYLVALAGHSKRNAILYATKWTQPGEHDPNLTSITEEDVQGMMEVVHGLRGADLDLIIHRPGVADQRERAKTAKLSRPRSGERSLTRTLLIDGTQR